MATYESETRLIKMRCTVSVSFLSFRSYDYVEKSLLALTFFPWKPKIDNVICYNDNLPTYISYVYMENLFVDDEKYV